MSPNLYSMELPDVCQDFQSSSWSSNISYLCLSFSRLKLDLKKNNSAHQVGISFSCVKPFTVMAWKYPSSVSYPPGTPA